MATYGMLFEKEKNNNKKLNNLEYVQNYFKNLKKRKKGKKK